MSIIAFALVTAFYFAQFFLQVSPGVLFPELAHDWSLDAAQFGFMSSAFLYTYVALQIPVGLLLDRYNAAVILAVAAFLFGVASCLFIFSPNLSTACISRMLMGASSAFAFLGALHIAMRRFLPRYFAMLAGMTETIGSLGAVAGNALFACLIAYFRWTTIYWFIGIMMFLISGLIYYFIKHSHPKTITPIKHQKPIHFIETFKIIGSHKAFYAAALYGFMIWGPMITFSGLWGVPFLREDNHISTATAATIISFAWLGLAIGSPVLGHLSDRLKRRRIFLVAAAAFGLVSMVLLIVFRGLPLPLLGTLLLIIGAAASVQSVTFGYVNDHCNRQIASTAAGVTNTVSVACGIVLQPLVGFYLDAHWAGQRNHHGLPIYHWTVYQVALIPLVVCYAIAILISLFWIKETFCKRVRLSR